ncbi:MAG: MFS transporter [Candidatus Hodarchaeales archaeon]
MLYVDTLLGVKNYPEELKSLTLKFFSLELIIAVIYLSHTWISLYYISILGSYALFGSIVATGMIFGIVLDLPLGVLTDRFGQRGAFCGALGCLTIYYFGLIFAKTSFQLLCLEILVGIFSALLSGSFIAWFLNSWENLIDKNEKSDKLFRSTMGNVKFVKMIAVSSLTILGGFLLFQAHLAPQLIFLLQGFIALVGFIFGFTIMVNYRPIERNRHINLPSENETTLKKSHIVSMANRLMVNYIHVSPYFLCFGILSFTSLAFTTIIFPVLVYFLLSPENFGSGNYFTIDFASVAILILSLVNSITDLVYGISSRFSGRFTASIKSPRQGLIVFYSINFPFAWISFFFILLLNTSVHWKLLFIVIIFLSRLLISGLTSGLHWQLYYDITNSEYRSSQESYFNTVSLIISILGFSLLGQIMEKIGISEAILFLFILSALGILILINTKEPEEKNKINLNSSI